MTSLTWIHFFAISILIISHHVNAAQSTKAAASTLADFINPSQSRRPNFDNSTGNYSIMAQFLRDAGLLQSLGEDAELGLTLFLPSNLAAFTTAEDIAYAQEQTLPKTEQQSYATIKKFINTFKKPDHVLSSLLKFHMLPKEMTFNEITGEDTYETMNGQTIDRYGLKLSPAEGQSDIVETFPLPELVYGPRNSFKTSNGFVHHIDRILFPRMSQFESTNGDADPPLQTTPNPNAGGEPGSGSIPSSPVESTVAVVPSISSSPDPDVPASVTPTATGDLTSDSEPACFPGSAILHLEDGTDVSLSQLAAGHVVRASETQSSMVYLFTHRKHDGIFDFVRIVTEGDHEINLTKGHYIYANGKLRAAGSVKVGDTLRTLDGSSKVRSVRASRDYGLFAPHTLHGDIVVNRIVASTYTTAVNPTIAHVMLWPLRAMTHIGITKEPLGSLLYEGAWGKARVLSQAV